MTDLPDLWLFDPSALGGFLIPLLLLWIILSLTAGYVAGERGRGRIRWVLIALLLTPIVALPLLRSLRRLSAPGDHAMPLGSEVRQCPTCREMVSATPMHCPNCNAEFPSDR